MLTNNYKRVATVSKVFARNLIIMNAFLFVFALLYKTCPIAGTLLMVSILFTGFVIAVRLVIIELITKIEGGVVLPVLVVLPTLGAVMLIPAMYELVMDKIIPYYTTSKEIFINTSNAYTSIIAANLFAVTMYVLFIVIEIKRKEKSCQAQSKNVEEDRTGTN